MAVEHGIADAQQEPGVTNDWRKLIEVYGRLVYTAAWRILRHQQDVEDVVQDVFAYVWAHRHEQQVEHWGGWLRRLAVCRSLDRLRESRALTCSQLDRFADGTEDASATDRAELDEALRRAVAQLPERQRVTFSMRYFENLSNQDIASQLGISDSAVSTSLHKARLTLAEQLSPVFEGDTR